MAHIPNHPSQKTDFEIDEPHIQFSMSSGVSLLVPMIVGESGSVKLDSKFTKDCGRIM